jgi:cation transport ATPase
LKVQQAQGFKASSQRLADRVTGWFVPAVIAIAIATFIIWYNVMGNVTIALITTVGVLIIASFTVDGGSKNAVKLRLQGCQQLS